MKTFRCKALLNGKEVVRKIRAADERAALTLCEREGLIPLEIEEERGRNKLFEISKRGVPQGEVAFALLQLSMLLEAGVSLPRALEVLASQVENERLSAALLSVKRAIERGEPVGKAFADAEVFPEFLPQMLSSVQTAGHLELVFKIAGTYLEKMEEIKGRVISALSYPAVVVGMSFLAVLVAVKVVLPKLEGVLQSFGKDLPLITKLVVAGVNLMTFAPPVLVVIFFLFRKKRTDEKLARLLLKLPAAGRITLYLNLARFASVMAMLLKAAVPLNRALALAAGSITNPYLRKKFEKLPEKVERGKRLSALLEEIEELPPLFVNMVATGEESGNLDRAFEKLTQIYEKYTYRTLDFWVSMVEPATIVLIALVVGLIVVSVMLPLVEITGGQILK